jgi:hypothetical protein
MDLAILENKGDPVLIDIGSRKVLTREPLQLDQNVTSSRLVQIRPLATGEIVLNPVHLEEVELEITEIRLVVAHPIASCYLSDNSNLNQRSKKGVLD